VKYYGADLNGNILNIKREYFLNGTLKDNILSWIENKRVLPEEVELFYF
jgi:hypothetical protein